MLARVRLESICQRRVVVYASLLLGMLAVPVLAAEGDGANTATSDGNAVPQPAIRVEEIVIRAPRVRIVSPLPGVGIDREQAATNIQSATAKEISESRAINITEFMNNNMQSVSINDYAGNPFQQDLNFRGFTASPMIGTPQGISVYLDSVRVNEAFGDVVNWDLLPMNAIASLDLLPGSSPLFGLNTLGGALAIRTKSGFTDHHARGEVIGGAWGRQQVQVSNGINNGVLGLFTAYNHFEEDGWRMSRRFLPPGILLTAFTAALKVATVCEIRPAQAMSLHITRQTQRLASISTWTRWRSVPMSALARITLTQVSIS
ncbi:TonB-dependent receptor plug domain-containing protein [Methylobacillus flagellatus]|uniref:TonB-dependent receptor, plug n=1 Tax=Methylobacillus flagellatus (strain ATCC 51484 / DSM 6875 / VKM B-1610 / KT) TaxID=265072 RepID=Q1GZN9_METFK|nr:Plug domain-containing protein [Methylobacillus flagellatus]ABE50298.1 TonB-dependent receptor, plug [Methylobacillus flagellatus KT]